jgi:hypothetical protein
MLNFHEFWQISDALDNDALRVKMETRMDEDEDVSLKRGELRPAVPVCFRQYMGGRLKDLIGSGGGQFMISNRLADTLRAGKFTGWSTYPAKIFGKKGEEITGYNGLAITGRCAEIDESRSEKVEELPGGKFRIMRGMFFDEKDWDGSDIFMIGVAGQICVKQKVYEAITSLKPTNIKFTRLDEATYLLVAGLRARSKRNASIG